MHRGNKATNFFSLDCLNPSLTTFRLMSNFQFGSRFKPVWKYNIIRHLLTSLSPVTDFVFTVSWNRIALQEMNHISYACLKFSTANLLTVISLPIILSVSDWRLYSVIIAWMEDSTLWYHCWVLPTGKESKLQANEQSEQYIYIGGKGKG